MYWENLIITHPTLISPTSEDIATEVRSSSWLDYKTSLEKISRRALMPPVPDEC